DSSITVILTVRMRMSKIGGRFGLDFLGNRSVYWIEFRDMFGSSKPGTSMAVEPPAPPKPRTSGPSLEISKMHFERQLKVLVVDDNAAMRKLLSLHFRRKGIEMVLMCFTSSV